MNKQDRYPLSVVLLHWLVALAIFANLAVGWLLDDATELMDLHRALGVLVLALAAARLLNRLLASRRLPASVNPAGTPQYLAEKAVHGLLYLGMLLVPLLGWLKTNAAGHELTLFDSLTLPTLLEKNRELSHLLGLAHSATAYALAMLIGLHVAGAIAHRLQGQGDVLRRMLPALRKP
ncbi:cytochrome b/b6 domain-containing protein [uncultured Aquitalea sp.]|uniref:cytochrome b n=1 Tax=uncultured Aquitalea sp. TaxID=540272 RepID=UPI0025E0DCA2|nr:cytochrome b/b6 domain-containing protein [uncultured Aquitalea sp.]